MVDQAVAELDQVLRQVEHVLSLLHQAEQEAQLPAVVVQPLLQPEAVLRLALVVLLQEAEAIIAVAVLDQEAVHLQAEVVLLAATLQVEVQALEAILLAEAAVAVVLVA